MFVVYGERYENMAGEVYTYSRHLQEVSALQAYGQACLALARDGYNCLAQWFGRGSLRRWLSAQIRRGGTVQELAEYVADAEVTGLLRLSLWERPDDGAMAVLWVEVREDGA